LDIQSENDYRSGQVIVIRNTSGTLIYWGGSDVTTANGVTLSPGEDLAMDIAGDTVYAIVGTGSAVVEVAQVGV
jgi:hypothetical protein